SKPPQRIAHLGKKQLGLVSQAEQRLGATHALARTYYFHHLVRFHSVRAGIAGVAPERAVSAIVAAEIRQGKKHLARIGNDSRLESGPGKLCRREEGRQHAVVRSQKAAGRFARDRVLARRGELSSG